VGAGVLRRIFGFAIEPMIVQLDNYRVAWPFEDTGSSRPLILSFVDELWLPRWALPIP
jgi:hypothetical protein